jgi:acyl dehydratase
MPPIAFEDFSAGAVFDYAGPHVTRDDIVAFAREFDPQPFHVDEQAAKSTFFGTLVGSGWHACALMMRTIADAVLLDSTSMGAPGIEETRWLTPLRPGDSLRVRQTVMETKASRSRPEMGLVHMRTELLNQHGKAILEQTNWSMFGRRGVAIAPFETDRPRPSPSAPLATPPVAGAQFPPPLKPDAKAAPYFDDVEIGTVAELGSYGFAADDVTAFARRFDPQPFHVDVEAARRSHFGELCASGWHTGAVWMKMMVRHRQAASRPDWGLVFSRNSGTNQFGDEVISFDGCAFWQRKPA